jgi:TldD protein
VSLKQADPILFPEMVSQPHDPTSLLQEVLARKAGGFVELRLHKKRTRGVAVEKGRVETAQATEHSGIGVRVHESGTWGFASTDRMEAAAIERAIDNARAAARAAAFARREKSTPPPPVELARGRFEAPGVAEAEQRSTEQLLQLALSVEAAARAASPSIRSATSSYSEVFEEKAIVTSDGACAWTRLVRPEFRVVAIAERAGEIQRGAELVGVTGGWECLFASNAPEELAGRAAQQALDLLSAGYPQGGRKRVLLSPAIVGLLTHEAIGHTVEADFVSAGSCAANRLGTRVASELVTLCDSGASEYHSGAGGTLEVDDEGVRTRRTVIIDSGILSSYLHDRESAARFGVEPTGNARAFEFDNEPLIRMRNTYIAPGTSELEQMIAEMEDGYLFDGASNGQADANGEFMFGTRLCWRIENGRRKELLRGVNISGQAFDVLMSVDAVGRDFRWDLGSGHCGKGQPAKVDAGGPWLRARVVVGGRR